MTAMPPTASTVTTVIDDYELYDCGCRYLPVINDDGSSAGLVFRGDFRGHEVIQGKAR